LSYRGGKTRPGSAGLGVYQAGSLRSAFRLLRSCRSRLPTRALFLSDRAMFDVGYFPPNTPSVE
jgi:hypothetical protein